MTNNFELAEYSRDDLFKKFCSGLTKTTKTSGRRIRHEWRVCSILYTILVCNYRRCSYVELNESYAHDASSRSDISQHCRFVFSFVSRIYRRCTNFTLPGAITIIMIFGIMLTKHNAEK